MNLKRKYLINIDYLPNSIKSLMIPQNRYEIEQYYVQSDSKQTIRITRCFNGATGSFDHSITFKYSIPENGINIRNELEMDITQEQFMEIKFFEESKDVKDIYKIKKTRYKIPYNGYLLEIDLYGKECNNFCVCEIEFKDQYSYNNYKQPIWVLKDISNDPKYLNSELAKIHLF